MRAVIQRVAAASVTVNDEVISSIGKGLMVLVGVGKDDTLKDMEFISEKILKLRVFNDTENPNVMWRKSVKDIEGDILCVSQFTLMANTTKGAKPDFHNAMGGATSKPLYESLLKRLGHQYKPEKIKDGEFGAMMSVALTNDGPVTLTIDSRKFEYVDVPAVVKKNLVKEQEISNNAAAGQNPTLLSD